MSSMPYRLHVSQTLGTTGMPGQYGHGLLPTLQIHSKVCFPVRFQRGEWWQDVDNVLVQDASIAYCPG
eukprot:4526294-Amphidinium_carterae.1